MPQRLTTSGELAGDSDYVADLRIRLTNFFLGLAWHCTAADVAEEAILARAYA